MLKHVRRATLALTTTALLSTGLAGSAHAADRPTPRASVTAAWLADQLGGDDLVHSEYQDFETGDWVGYTDYGLSLDFFYAFDGLGIKRAVRHDILDAIEAQVGSYIGTGSNAYAGAIGKLLTAVEAQGRDPFAYSDEDLVAKLVGLVHTADDSQKGRASDAYDASDPYAGDFSNTLGQSFVVRALTGVKSSVADETTEFLLKQQCEAGYFRLYMESSDHTCDSGTASESGPSVDATAAAVVALLEVERAGVPDVDQAALRGAVVAAGRWLVSQQKRSGAFTDGTGGTGDTPTPAPNANSTGLAAQALADLGKKRAAADSAHWLGSLQVTKRRVRATAFARRDLGAVAFSKAALREGKDEGITRDVRYQWRRAAAQAAVALDSLGK